MTVSQCIARLATKTGSRTFCQATYFGRNGEVEFDALVGANITPDGIEIFLLPGWIVQNRSIAQHQRHVSRSISMHREPDRIIHWDELGISMEELQKLR